MDRREIGQIYYNEVLDNFLEDALNKTIDLEKVSKFFKKLESEEFTGSFWYNDETKEAFSFRILDYITHRTKDLRIVRVNELGHIERLWKSEYTGTNTKTIELYNDLVKKEMVYSTYKSYSLDAVADNDADWDLFKSYSRASLDATLKDIFSNIWAFTNKERPSNKENKKWLEVFEDFSDYFTYELTNESLTLRFLEEEISYKISFDYVNK